MSFISNDELSIELNGFGIFNKIVNEVIDYVIFLTDANGIIAYNGGSNINEGI